MTIKIEHERFWGVMELFCTLIMVVVTQIYACVKIHETTPKKSISLYDLKIKFKNKIILF